MKRETRREQAVIRGMESRFMTIRYDKKYRGEVEEQNIHLDEHARMELFIAVMSEIAASPAYFKRQYEVNVFKALYMVEAARLLEENYPDHALFQSRNYRIVIEGLHNYVESNQTHMHMAEMQERKDYDNMMSTISDGLGMRTEEEDRIGTELETVMRDIAEMEGINLDELINTPTEGEEEVAATLAADLETDQERDERHEAWLNTDHMRALINGTLLTTPDDQRPPPMNPAIKRKNEEEPQPSTSTGGWTTKKNRKMLKLDLFSDISDIELTEDSPDWGRANLLYIYIV